jgi:ribose transport system ATP-binding protein
VFGIAGLVGAGRTELLRALFGLDRICKGRLRVGSAGAGTDPAHRLARGIGMLSEDRSGEGLAVSLSVTDNVTLSRMTGLGPLGLVLPHRSAAAARNWIAQLAIRCRDERQRVAGLSGGNQQKVAFARLLHHGVDVLLLDDPTKGVDVASKAQIYALIDRLACGDEAAGRPPCAVLVVSSYLPELLGVCDRIAVMARGVLGPARPAGEWTERELLRAAIGKEAA